ncbi:ergothioneine biosynthesis protein EgtB [Minwuia sp.]|uniref:ergothioneine biosynthesis protein EgtB n=1 Tax=Minwuia sp. TaxID=2493630 RepID=UPI003A8EC31E
MPDDAQPLPQGGSLSYATAELARRFRQTRAQTTALAEPLAPEDQVVQPMDDASPTKWHLAHTTWFYETFILTPFAPDYEPFDPHYAYLFNSYYEGAGERHPRPHRGLLTRPTVAEISAYRAHVDRAMAGLLEKLPEQANADIATLTELGINHEQQHQELIMTDLLYLFSCNPMSPAYSSDTPDTGDAAIPLDWISFDGGIRQIGHQAGFAYDNEGPRHDVLLQPYRLANRAVTNGEWLEFMADGGYGQHDLWLSDGWATVQRENWQAPLYWQRAEGEGAWRAFGLHGLIDIDPAAPVRHISYYEADAFARWAGKRLPTEAEWEVASEGIAPEGNSLGTGTFAPKPAQGGEGLRQMFGDVWEWTASPYVGYPGFRAPEGAVGEYNGKFMSGQMVLRGGSCVTPEGHVRASYRNFFYPHQRWQFAGLRLAEDA